MKYLEKRKVTGLFLKRESVCVRVPGVLGVVVPDLYEDRCARKSDDHEVCVLIIERRNRGYSVATKRTF